MDNKTQKVEQILNQLNIKQRAALQGKSDNEIIEMFSNLDALQLDNLKRHLNGQLIGE